MSSHPVVAPASTNRIAASACPPAEPVSDDMGNRPSLKFDLTWAEAKAFARNRGEHVAMDPRGDRAGSAFGHQPYSARKPTGLATGIATAIVLDDPTAQRDLAHRHSTVLDCLEHRFAQATIEHDWTRAQPLEFAAETRQENTRIALVAGESLLCEAAHRLVAFERGHHIAQLDLLPCTVTGLRSMPGPTELGGGALAAEDAKSIEVSAGVLYVGVRQRGLAGHVSPT